jgi:hypothetical protein
VKQILQWCCYVFGGLALVLGCMMLMAGRFSLGSKAILIGTLIFLPIGYYFRLLAQRQPVQESTEAGD